MFPPGPASLHLRPPDGRVTLALAAPRVEPVHTLLTAPIDTPTTALSKYHNKEGRQGGKVEDYLRVFLQHHLLPSLLLVAALQVGLDHHLHLLLTNLSTLNRVRLLVVVWCGVVWWCESYNPMSAICC